MNNAAMERTATLMGAFSSKKGFAFRTWAPHAKSVTLTGDFNKWDKKKHQMEAEEGGHWYIEIPNAKNGQKYKFLIETAEGEILERTDPYARRVENSVGKSIIYKDDFDWKDDNFEIQDWNSLIIYELHIGTFNVIGKQKLGTFKSAIKKLPHLQELGINAIEVLPLNEFAGDFSWGYNPAHPYTIEEAYGHPDDFKKFVKAAHEHGMAVILDVVYNHLGPTDLPMWQFDGWSENDDDGGIYFYNDWRAETPWGDTRPNYGRQEVRDYFFNNAMMWLDEYRCDGIRFDAVSYIRNVKGWDNDGDNLKEGYELMQRINREAKQRFPKKIMIAEDSAIKDFVTNSPDFDNGMGFGAQWDIDFAHEVRSVLLESEDTKRNIGSIAAAISREVSGDAFKRVVFTESHDEVANGQERVASAVSEDSEKVNNYFSKKLSALATVVTMTSAGIPLMFQGKELLEDKWFSDTDPLDWKRKKKFLGIFNLHRDLIKLRSNHEGITKGLLGRNTEITHFNDQNKVLAYARYYDDIRTDSTMVILNFSNESFEEYKLKMPSEGNWKLVFNSGWEGYSKYFGDFEVNDVTADETGEVTINLPAYAGLIFVKA